jgi:integrase
MRAVTTKPRTEQQQAKLPHINIKKGRYYFRTKTYYGGALPNPDDPTFKREYARKCHAAGVPMPTGFAGVLLEKPELPAKPTLVNYLPGSVGWFILQYEKSREFDAFGKMTRYNYRKMLDMIRDRIGAAQLRDIDTENLDHYTAGVFRKHGPSTADQHLRLISNLWEFAKDFREFGGQGKSNPTREAKKRYKVKQAHKPWPEHIIKRFLDGANPYMQCAFHLLLYTGQRRGDVINMRWSDLTGDLAPGVRILVVQEKTGEPLSLRVHKKLLAFLKTWPRHDKTILTSSWKRGYTADSLSHRVKDRLREIGADAYTLHGLRKNAGIALAEAGATVQEIMAVLGHRTPKMALYYVKEASKLKLNDAAMDKWEAA